jgi:20S proteasome subunit alpha 3
MRILLIRDKNFGYQLYQSDPAGNYSGWQAAVVGRNNRTGKSQLKTDYKEGSTVDVNSKLAVKILLKTMDAATPSPEKIELSTLKLDASGKIVHVVLGDALVRK